ncbi:hypothetical protein PLESTM_001903000 [Pleodorina starrii]|nr:hypothetical protein PLESTM_001903000 [Pleodorina starrii]
MLSSMPRLLADASDAKRAANPDLHECGCTCAPCKEQRRITQQQRLAGEDVMHPPAAAAAAAAPTATTAAAATAATAGDAKRQQHSPAAASASAASASCGGASAAASSNNLTSSGGAISSSNEDEDTRNSNNSSGSAAAAAATKAKSPLSSPSLDECCGSPSSFITSATAAAAAANLTAHDLPVFDFSRPPPPPAGGDGTSSSGGDESPSLLCDPPKRHDAQNRTVWKWRWSRGGGQELVAKVMPCHSAHRAAEIRTARAAGGRFPTRSGRLAPITTVREATREARMAHAVPDGLFVQPLGVFLRRCALAGGPRDAGHDLEVVIVYPYHRHGSSGDYILRLAMGLAVAVAKGQQKQLGLPEVACGCGGGKCYLCRDYSGVMATETAEPEDAAAELATEVYGMCLDMFGLADRTHCNGFIIHDLKPENMVKTEPTGRYRFIDAEYVAQSPPGGGVCKTPYLGTDYYAAPEQQTRRWSEPRSDVFACGRSIRRIVDTCTFAFRKVLLEAGWLEAQERAQVAFLAVVEPLTQLEKACVRTAARRRPTAAAAFDMILRYLG